MRSSRSLAILLLLLGAWAAHAQWVYVLGAGGEIAVLGTTSRTVERTIRLSHPSPDKLYPTPGGKYVLVTYSGTADISAVDVEQHAETRSFVLSTGRADSLTFSPMGDTVLTTQAGSDRIEIWSHSRSVLEHQATLSAGVAGTPALFNRRATRLYRSGAAGLQFVYLKTGELIAEVSHPGGRMAWGFTPDFRSLWGVALDGAAVVVVDEARSRIVETLELPHRPHEPVISEDGSRLYLIDPAGRSITAVDTRTRKTAGRIDLPTVVTGIAAYDTNELWASDPEGRLYVADTRKLLVVANLGVGGATRQMSLVTLRKGEGYACF